MTDSSAATDAMVLERSFDAPVDLVWQMWTDPEHFKAWYGPDGASITVAEFDLRVGGARRVCMEVNSPNGLMRMWFAGKHVEIDRPARLVYTESMAGEDGTPMPPEDHPETTEIRVELSDVSDTTRMRLTHVGIPAGSPGATGWTMALDKLAARLEASGRAGR